MSDLQESDTSKQSKDVNKETEAIEKIISAETDNGNPADVPNLLSDTKDATETKPQINPEVIPTKHSPLLEITESSVKGAEIAHTTLKHFGRVLTEATSIAIDAYRIGSSIHDDIKIRENAPDILKEIDEVLQCLHEKKDKTSEKHEIEEITNLIHYYERLKKEVKLIENKVPCRTIKTGASIGSGILTGAAGAAGGGWAGFHAGAVIGTSMGPVGTAFGAIIGGIIGSVTAGIASGIAGRHIGGTVAEWGLEKTHDIMYKDNS